MTVLTAFMKNEIENKIIFILSEINFTLFIQKNYYAFLLHID